VKEKKTRCCWRVIWEKRTGGGRTKDREGGGREAGDDELPISWGG